MRYGTKIKDEIRCLEQELTIVEDELAELERNGIHGGEEYDSLVQEAIIIEQDLDGLRLADDEDVL